MVICLFLLKEIFGSVTAYCSLSTQMKNTFLIGLVRPGVDCSHCFMALMLTQTCEIIIRVRRVFKKN